jgi:hypothetical protein
MNLPDNTKLRIAELHDITTDLELMLHGVTVLAGTADANLIRDAAQQLDRAALLLRSRIRQDAKRPT